MGEPVRNITRVLAFGMRFLPGPINFTAERVVAPVAARIKPDYRLGKSRKLATEHNIDKWKVQAQDAQNLGKEILATRLCLRIIKTGEYTPDVMIKASALFLNGGQTDAAIKLLDVVIAREEVGSNSWNMALNNRASAYVMSKSFQLAFDDYKLLCQSCTNSLIKSSALTNMAQLGFTSSQGEAIGFLDEAIAIIPEEFSSFKFHQIFLKALFLLRIDSRNPEALRLLITVSNGNCRESGAAASLLLSLKKPVDNPSSGCLQ